MENEKHRNYPSMQQSLGMTGLIVLAMIFLSPVTFLKDVIGIESSVLLYYVLSMGGSFWVIQFVRKKKSASAGFNFILDDWRIAALVSLGAVALLFGVVTPLTSLIPMPDFFKQEMVELAGQNGIMAFIVMVIAAPVFEELIFRGIMLDGFLKKYSPAKAILWSSILFGVVHLNPWQFVAGLVMGIFIGWVYYHTRSLAYAIIIHASANLSGFIMRLYIDPGEYLASTSDVGFFGGATNYAILIIVCVSICLINYLFLRRAFNKNRPVDPDGANGPIIQTSTDLV
ncbi:MAG: CPBP family intramembrane metalloprotease [Cyclobacteriaceae bacterium]|nr:CPBP family intramembrane metalloprotease [Cyclobacteriaceae bacterium HetDA_MAG_MS6]